VGSTWVVNASPLISLGRVGQIELLPQLCDEIVIPEGVAQEIESGPPRDPAAVWLREHGHRFVLSVALLEPAVVAWDLGMGESQVLSLCFGRAGAEAVLDDRAARRCAASLRVPVRGTLSVLVLAKRRGLVPAVRPVLDNLVANGFRAARHLSARILRLAGESPNA
jgi:predicted nucleic acid-binding protein